MSPAVFYLKPVPRHSAEAALSSSFARIGHRLADFFSFSAPVVPETVSHLLDLADQYESSQPSYAADLRHAAMNQLLTQY